MTLCLAETIRNRLLCRMSNLTLSQYITNLITLMLAEVKSTFDNKCYDKCNLT